MENLSILGTPLSGELLGIQALFDEPENSEIKKWLTRHKILSLPVLPVTILSYICMSVHSYSHILFSVRESEFTNDVICEYELGIRILCCKFSTVELQNLKGVPML